VVCGEARGELKRKKFTQDSLLIYLVFLKRSRNRLHGFKL